MNEIDRQFQLYHQHKTLVQGKAMRRLTLATGISEANELWRLEVAEYLQAGVDAEQYIQAVLRNERTNKPLPSSMIRRQIELHIGFTVRVMDCPVQINEQHLAKSKPVEGSHGTWP